jgi:signal transduction histidine kinase
MFCQEGESMRQRGWPDGGATGDGFGEETDRLDWLARAVCHDLRGPLAALGLASDLLGEMLSEPPDESFMADLGTIHKTIDRSVLKSEALIADLLCLATAGDAACETAPVEVRPVVQSVLEEHYLTITEKHLVIDIDDDLGYVNANPVHVYQVFSNLIGNAIQHNDSSYPVIKVCRAGQDHGGANRFLVRDNGSGIEAEDLEKIFTPFVKGPSGNIGLGLSIVARIVDAYGGQVVAYNDGGACFEFSMRRSAGP